MEEKSESTKQKIVVLLNNKNSSVDDLISLLNASNVEDIVKFKHSNGNNLLHFISGPNYCNTFFPAVKILCKLVAIFTLILKA